MNKVMSFYIIIIFILLLFPHRITYCQNIEVDFNLNLKHEVGGVSEFKRSKYITMHTSNYDGDWIGEEDMLKYLLEDLDVYMGRETGHITLEMFYPESVLPTRGEDYIDQYSTFTLGHKYEPRQELIVACQDRSYSAGGGKELGAKIGLYLENYFGSGGVAGRPKPKFVEVLNEPLWAEVDAHRIMDNNPIDNEDEVIDEVFQFHKDVAIELKKYSPETMVGGFCTAFPNHEVDNFNQWERRWKKFIDDCGTSMDFYSFHLYDFPGKDGLIQLRKGGNMEATMDMIAHYDMLAYGTQKPFLISEYGSQVHDWYFQQWSAIRDWQMLKAFSSMMIQFMERPDRILKTIPFSIAKALWGTSGNYPYYWRLMRRENEPGSFTGNWIWSEVIKFYELWSDVRGTRIDSKSTDLDLQVDAYVNGNEAYLILNNIEPNSVNVELNLLGSNNTIEQVEIKHLYLDNDEPKLETNLIGSIPNSVIVHAEATMIVKCIFESQLDIDNTMSEKKYYADTYKEPIFGNVTTEFNFDGIDIEGFGEATLRLGVGREHGSILKPVVKFNDTYMEVPIDYRGDTQDDRESFFGMLEIEIPYQLLGALNKVEVRFPDGGGHISSAILQVFNSDIAINRSWEDSSSTEGTVSGLNNAYVYPNPARNYLTVSGIPEGEYQVKIINMQGVELLNRQIIAGYDNMMLLNNIPDGCYILTVSDGNSTKSVRFLKVK